MKRRATCQHCHRHDMAIAGRGLCGRCYAYREIREQYASYAGQGCPAGHAGIPGTTRSYEDAAVIAERVTLYERRAQEGRDLWTGGTRAECDEELLRRYEREAVLA